MDCEQVATSHSAGMQPTLPRAGFPDRRTLQLGQFLWPFCVLNGAEQKHDFPLEASGSPSSPHTCETTQNAFEHHQESLRTFFCLGGTLLPAPFCLFLTSWGGPREYVLCSRTRSWLRALLTRPVGHSTPIPLTSVRQSLHWENCVPSTS